MKRRRFTGYLSFPMTLSSYIILCLPLAAQAPRPSQHGSVSQQIADTLVILEYNRPVARGRELFGKLVPWGRIWNPGADDATSITLSTDVQVNGQKLASGTYSLWAEPQPDRWTIIFSRAHPVFHVPYPAGKDALRVMATPRTGQHMETLAFYFPAVDGKKAELVLHWGTVVVPLELEVP
ncbi:MAG: DUF2911 domain-containing protein [Acidobacteria bacterium]|nr:DUF2911 domain-containing protein [Acidobacteriota bacterium]